MNSKNGKACNPHRLLLSLSNKINLKRSNKYIALSNLSMYIHYQISKSYTKIINLKHLLLRGMKGLNYLMDHILYIRYPKLF